MTFLLYDFLVVERNDTNSVHIIQALSVLKVTGE